MTQEQLNAGNKASAIDYALSLQSQLPISYREIPASPATEAKVENGITVVPATEAKPAISIREQLLAGTTYVADCEAIDKANEAGELAFKSNPETAAILTAKENAAKFETENAAILTEIQAIKKSFLTLNRKPLQDAMARMTELENSLSAKYPADYELSFSEIPTFTPAQYPDIDTYFPNGISGNFPASFLLGAKKSARAKSANTGTSHVQGSELPTTGNFKYLKATATAGSDGLTLNTGSEVATEHVKSCPAGTIKTYNAKVADGSILNGKVVKPITGSWSAMASLVSGSSKAASVWSEA